ncbi:hypothetical protein BDD43_3949 [Mucilaginibacter gracilis]|uniref:Uncharacterized protein n=1 Tax=Mucilaginibacter gracilis TaxID=423350 RepID=A0A495J424_9SPHI|nr:hypothetical protein BDD43_3949 [Mucilaginibacter gracilis]
MSVISTQYNSNFWSKPGCIKAVTLKPPNPLKGELKSTQLIQRKW